VLYFALKVQILFHIKLFIIPQIYPEILAKAASYVIWDEMMPGINLTMASEPAKVKKLENLLGNCRYR
jgi:hypothetical protein